MPEFCEAKSHLRAINNRKRLRRYCSRMHGLLEEESYIAPVASLATAVSEQGRNI